MLTSGARIAGDEDGLTFGEFLKRQAAEKRSKRAAASDGTALKAERFLRDVPSTVKDALHARMGSHVKSEKKPSCRRSKILKRSSKLGLRSR